MYDIIVIGAGVIGCAIARELSKYNAKILVVEKCEDVCTGTSKANSAIIHSGYDAKNGTLKAKFNVEGNRMMDRICEELDVPFKRIGSLTVCTDESRVGGLSALKERGEKNGVVAKALCKLCLADSLLLRTANARNHNDNLACFSLKLICLLLCELKNGLKEIVLRIADLKLGGVNCNRKSANAGIEIVSYNRSLALFVKFAVFVKCKGVRGDNCTLVKLFKC